MHYVAPNVFLTTAWGGGEREVSPGYFTGAFAHIINISIYASIFTCWCMQHPPRAVVPHTLSSNMKQKTNITSVFCAHCFTKTLQ